LNGKKKVIKMKISEKEIQKRAKELQADCHKEIEAAKASEPLTWKDEPTHQDYTNSWLFCKLAEQSLMIEHLNELIGRIADQANEVDNRTHGQIIYGPRRRKIGGDDVKPGNY